MDLHHGMKFLFLFFNFQVDPRMLNEDKIVPNPLEKIAKKNASNSDDEDENDVEVAFEAKILANISNQFEKSQNQMQQFFNFQIQANLNLYKKMGEFVDVAKLLFYKNNNAKAIPSLSSSSSSSSSLNADESERSSSTAANNSIVMNLNADETERSSSTAANNSNDNDMTNASSSEGNDDAEDKENSKVNPKSSKNNEAAMYDKFKKRYEKLLENAIPSRFSHLNFKELRSSDECKKAGIPKTLDTIDGEHHFFKYIHKTRH